MQQPNNNGQHFGFGGLFGQPRDDVPAVAGFVGVGRFAEPAAPANDAPAGGFGAAFARQASPLNAICRALQNVGIDHTAFKRASIKPGLSDEDLLALPDMPWDWAQISKHKMFLKECTLLALADKDWDYKQLSRFSWSNEVLAELKDKDWDFSNVKLQSFIFGKIRSADLLLQTTTKNWNWFLQLDLLVCDPWSKAALKVLLRKALLKSDEVVWDWHKPFKNKKLANALLGIALTEIPKCPDEPWDYEKLSAAWWYPIDALLSVGIDKPWNMDLVSAREDLTADHVFRLYPTAKWNYDITDKNPHALKAARRRQELLRARDIILKVASSVPYGRLYLRQKKAFKKRQSTHIFTFGQPSTDQDAVAQQNV